MEHNQWVSHSSITDWGHFMTKFVAKVGCVYFLLSAHRTLLMSVWLKDIGEITTFKDLSVCAET